MSTAERRLPPSNFRATGSKQLISKDFRRHSSSRLSISRSAVRCCVCRYVAEQAERAERHIFRQRTQLQGESIRLYLQGLKHLAKTCNFGSNLEENQFVSGLYSEEMRSRIFAEKNIDYKRAVELANWRSRGGGAAREHGGCSGCDDAGADALHRVSGRGPARRRVRVPAEPAAAAARAMQRRAEAATSEQRTGAYRVRDAVGLLTRRVSVVTKILHVICAA
ncbi:unnamed protein product [Euphydryas editha]|uniref:Uncharacterized protein n=1 Tax=Euphydryas editha TaxID=104508 RepID=A0AAU9UJI0_EUPED|nr:unnamed protein product [Euphydryas editha]